MRFDARVDQAEGLRRLLVRNHTRVATLVAGKCGVGQTCATINIAAALAHSGKEVLVLDENLAPNNLLDQLGLHARYDLLDVAHDKCHPRNAVLNSNGFSVLSTARAMNFMAQLNQSEQQRLDGALAEACTRVDMVLVDAAMPERQVGAPSNLTSGASLLVVMDATSSGITDSYALIKRLVLGNACLQFEIVLNKISDEKAAVRAFENMAKVAWNNLRARLNYLGCIPRDDRLKRAVQLGRPVISVYPTATSAKACQEIAQRLLHLPVRQVDTDSGMHGIMPFPARQLSQQMLLQYSKKVTHAVNC